MDADRFDALAKTVFASSRRGLLGALAAGTLGRLGLAPTAAQTGCKAVGRPCGEGAQCCSKLCTGTCVCREIGERCAADANCCIGRCRDGRCRCSQNASCPTGARCCEDGLCHQCCTNDHCPGDQKCCPAAELNVCVDSECGRDADCGVASRCQDCKTCVCDREKCGNSRLNGCCLHGTCRDGTGPIVCGPPGTTCDVCRPSLNQKCDPKKRRCVCDPENCRNFQNGCCKGKSCKDGDSNTECGRDGQTCVDCTKKGAGWVCRNKRCCKATGTCPSSCPRNGACQACCGGRCTGGKCGNTCGTIECESGAPCCGSSTKKCCQPGEYCCGETECRPPSVNDCGGCGQRCNNLMNPARADRCVEGQCQCGGGAPCDCTKGTFCEGGTCVCGAEPGWKLCQWDDNPCTYNSVSISESCLPGSTEVCRTPA